MQLGKQNDPRKYNKLTREQKLRAVSARAVEDEILNVCDVCGLDEFFTKLTSVGEGKFECVRCLREIVD